MKVIDLSVASDFKDFEDAVQCCPAVNAKVDCLITRNKKDYATGILPILTPEEFFTAIAVEFRDRFGKAYCRGAFQSPISINAGMLVMAMIGGIFV